MYFNLFCCVCHYHWAVTKIGTKILLLNLILLINPGSNLNKIETPPNEKMGFSAFSAIDPRSETKKKPHHIADFDRIDKLKTRKQSREKVTGYRVKKLDPRNFKIQFNLESYLHQDKINEIINIEGLEKTLDDVLTIPDEEMTRLMGCSGNTINLLGRFCRIAK